MPTNVSMTGKETRTMHGMEMCCLFQTTVGNRPRKEKCLLKGIAFLIAGARFPGLKEELVCPRSKPMPRYYLSMDNNLTEGT